MSVLGDVDQMGDVNLPGVVNLNVEHSHEREASIPALFCAFPRSEVP